MNVLGRRLRTILDRFEPPAPTSEQATLDTHQVTFAFNGVTVLDEVDLHLESGQMVGIIGPNGAGKSTLVRLLSRLLTPREGHVSLNGHRLAQWRPSDLARILAVVPQNPELPPAFTAWEIVLMGRTPFLGWTGRDSERDRGITRRAMEETNTWHLAERLVSQLSGGEQQRVVIARALAQEPQVLLLDEPTAHLDINHQIETLSLITGLVTEWKLAALAIFHDLNLAAQHCDELVLLHRGRIIAKGPPHQVLTPTVLRQVYGTEVMVMQHPLNGLPVVVPVRVSRSIRQPSPA